MTGSWTGAHGAPTALDLDLTGYSTLFDNAMECQKTELAAIASCVDMPTFDNTIEPYEASGRALSRIARLYGLYRSTVAAGVETEADSATWARLAKFRVDLCSDPTLFERIEAVRNGAFALELDQARLVEAIHREFARRGGGRSCHTRERVATINSELARLCARYRHSVHAAENEHTLSLAATELAGLSSVFCENAKLESARRGVSDRWLVPNKRSCVTHVLRHSPLRQLRERAWRMWTALGAQRRLEDNDLLIARILELRHERASLLGHPSHAHYAIDDRITGCPYDVAELLIQMWDIALPRARDELSELSDLLRRDHPSATLEPWDYEHYSYRVRESLLSFNFDQLGQYLTFDTLRNAMMWLANQLYDLTFVRENKVPVYHKDVEVYVVSCRGEHMGLWYLDPFARQGKMSGAWMMELQTQERFSKLRPIVFTASSIATLSAGGEEHLTWDDAHTLFHEFGHMLHSMLSNVRYKRLAGTNVSRELLEVPSQLHERWLYTPELLNRLVVRGESGSSMPESYVRAVVASRTFRQALPLVNQLAISMDDLALHLSLGDEHSSASSHRLHVKLQDSPKGLRRSRVNLTPSFADEGYAGSYYTYVLARVTCAQICAVFDGGTGMYDTSVAKHLNDTVLSVGGSVPAKAALRAFGLPAIDWHPMMQELGFSD